MKRLAVVSIILVILQGCCNAGGIKGAIEYQVDACSKTGFSNFAFDMSGQFAAPQTIVIEGQAEQAATLNDTIRNAAWSEAAEIRRAQWLQANPDGQ